MSNNSCITFDWNRDHYDIIHEDIDSNFPYSHYRHKDVMSALRKAREIQLEKSPEYSIIIGKLEGDL